MCTMQTKNSNISDMSVRELKGIREKIKYMTITTEKLQWNLYVSNFAVVNLSKNVSELRCIFWLDRGGVGGDYFQYFPSKEVIIWVERLFEGQLLFEEIWYMKYSVGQHH